MSKSEDRCRIFWDQRASSYGLNYQASYTSNLKFLLLERLAEPNYICVDIGIANGIFSLPLASKVREIHGVDISPSMLAECRANMTQHGIHNIHLYQASAEHLPFSRSFADLIYSFGTLLLVPDIRQAFTEIARVLKPGGLAVLDITGKYNLSRVYWDRYYRNIIQRGIHSFSFREAVNLFAGFQILEIHPTGFCDQWKYVPGLKRLKRLEKICHRTWDTPDWDYAVSRLFPSLANRWYFVVKKEE